jgi:hypothetical protein
MDWWSSCNERGALPRGRIECDVLAESLGREQPIEFDRDAAFEVTNDLGGGFADHNGRTDRRFGRDGERGARNRNVDEPGEKFLPVRQFQRCMREPRRNAFMPTILGHAERLPVGEPGELIGELFALDHRQLHLDRETLLEMARDRSFNAADLIQISDDALADAALGGSREGDAARRNVDGLARIFASIFEHVAARQHHFDALMTTALLDLGLYQRHRAGVHVCAFPNRLNIVVLSLARRSYCLLG